MPCQVAQRSSSPSLYPTAFPASDYQLEQSPVHYQSQVEALSRSPGHYQPPLDQPLTRGPNLATHLKPSSYQHIVAGHNYQASGSAFTEMDEANQRGFSQRVAPPMQNYSQQQRVEHQRTNSPVRVKKENLDQAYLDDGEWD